MTYSPRNQTMQKSIAEANEGITHAQFVAGAQSGTIGFKCMIGEPRQFLAGAHKAIFSIFVLLYTISPLILVPIWAYHERNAWLLLGIPVSYIASYSAAAHSKLIFLLQVLCIGVWLKAGFSFHQYITFFFFCSLWGYLFFQVAESTQTQHALQALIQHPDVFDRAITQHRIMIVRKEECAISI